VKDSIDCRQEISCCIRFDNVGKTASAQRFFRNIRRTILAHEHDFGHGRKLPDLSSGFDAINCRKSYVDQDQVWLQLLRFSDGLSSVRHLLYNSQV